MTLIYMSNQQQNQPQQGNTVDKTKNAVAEAAAQLQKDDSPISQLLSVIIMREAREAAKAQAEEEAKQIRQAKRNDNARHTAQALLEHQMRCKHLKGGRRGPKAGVKDYAISMHTFIGKNSYIKCHLCSAKWEPSDTKETLFRKGKHIRNHTKIGWDEAIAMMGQSTNTPTSSEIPLDATPRAIKAGQTLTDEFAEFEL